MTETLTSLIAKTQAQLLDNGTLFSTPTVTAAMRQALNELNKKAPLQLTELITAIANQKEYELSDQAPTAQMITDILLDGDNEYSVALNYAPFNEDGRVFFRLREYLTAGETIIVHYTAPHTIYGLDSATETTLSDELVAAIINGACAFCCQIRAAATIESNNVQTNVSENWLKSANAWRSVFTRSLADALKEPTPHGESSTQAWNDSQHSEVYP